MIKSKSLKIIKEPLGGAHQNPQKIYTTLKKEILNTFFILKKQSISKLLENRMSRFTEMGVYNE